MTVDYNEAIKDLDTAIYLSPDNLSLVVSRGSIKFNAGLYNEAVNDFTFVIDSDANTYSEAYFNRGVAKLRLNLKDAACKDFYLAKEKGYNNADLMISQNCK